MQQPGRPVRRNGRGPDGPVRQGRSQGRCDAPLLASSGTHQHRGVVAVGLAQELQSVFTDYDRCKDGSSTAAMFSFAKADRRVSVFYFYLWDQ
jgi:hypothetical protein